MPISSADYYLAQEGSSFIGPPGKPWKIIQKSSDRLYPVLTLSCPNGSTVQAAFCPAHNKIFQLKNGVITAEIKELNDPQAYLEKN